MQSVRVARKSICPALARLSKKREVVVYCCDEPHHVQPSCWSEGSRTLTSLVEIRTGGHFQCQSQTSPSSGSVDSKIMPKPGQAIVEHGTFCGKYSTLRIRVLPEDLPFVLGIKNLPDGMPVGSVADWLEDNGRADESHPLRMLLGQPVVV